MKKTREKQALVTYELFHSAGDFFFTAITYGRRNVKLAEIRDAFLKGSYEFVWKFEKPLNDKQHQLEVIFQESQNLEDSWRGELECRSTSVGDVIRVNGEYWIIAGTGFDFGWKD